MDKCGVFEKKSCAVLKKSIPATIKMFKGALYSNFDFRQNNIYLLKRPRGTDFIVHFVLQSSQMELEHTEILKLFPN